MASSVTAGPVASLTLAVALLSCLLVACHGGEREHAVFREMNVEKLGASSATTCSTPDDAFSTPSTLKVTYAHGPCSPAGANATADPVEVLLQDGQRVGRLHRRFAPNASREGAPSGSRKPELPLPSGAPLAVGGAFVITLGLGTPRRSQTVYFDTGSDTCWVQCQPCLPLTCYPQQDAVFNPFLSLTFLRVPCFSPTCFLSGFPTCAITGQCVYGVLYGDLSASLGTLSRDTLALTPDDVVPFFLFGCSAAYLGSFGRTAGLFGFARSPLSLNQQISGRYGNRFSYCLPASTSSAGYFRFGADQDYGSSTFFTPMLTDRRSPIFYGIALTGISVAGQQLPISPTIFSEAGTVIDSGTTLTYLPPEAYSALRSAFRSAMSTIGFGSPFAVETLDTCYSVGPSSATNFPAVTLDLMGGSLDLRPENIFYRTDDTVICLAFVGNGSPTEISILGNVQQKGYEIVHDLGLSRIGFTAAKC